MAGPDWEEQVLAHSKLERVFLTNDFDDPLEGFDTHRYIPCLRTDDLVFHLANEVRARLAKAPAWNRPRRESLRGGDRQAVRAFHQPGARGVRDLAAARLSPAPVEDAYRPSRPQACWPGAQDAGGQSRRTLSGFVFWTLAECARARLPFDLMIGVNRRRLRGGVYQGQDLYDSRTSLIQYRELFNAFPQVTFPDLGAGATTTRSWSATPGSSPTW
jgi:glucuronate isomerase